jgi:lysozyme
MLLRGCDVSKWQGPINWKILWARGIRVVYIKTTEGTTGVDPTYAINLQRAEAAGFLIGKYHYFTNNLDPAQQAKNFCSIAKEVQLPPALDLESLLNLPKDLAVRALVWLQLVKEQFNMNPLVYSNPNMIKNYLPRYPQYLDLGMYPLWIAHYGVTSPQVDQPWFPFEWVGWQFTCKANGPFYGVSSLSLDLDVFDADFLGLSEVDFPN